MAAVSRSLVGVAGQAWRVALLLWGLVAGVVAVVHVPSVVFFTGRLFPHGDLGGDGGTVVQLELDGQTITGRDGAGVVHDHQMVAALSLIHI